MVICVYTLVDNLTLNVWGPSNPGSTRSVAWLLMPCRLRHKHTSTHDIDYVD